MTTRISMMDRDEFLAAQRAEAAEIAAIEEATANEREIARLLNQLRDAETDLAASEGTYEALRESLAGKS